MSKWDVWIGCSDRGEHVNRLQELNWSTALVAKWVTAMFTRGGYTTSGRQVIRSLIKWSDLIKCYCELFFYILTVVYNVKKSTFIVHQINRRSILYCSGHIVRKHTKHKMCTTSPVVIIPHQLNKWRWMKRDSDDIACSWPFNGPQTAHAQ